MSIITYCQPILTRILKCLLLTLNRCSCFSHGVGSSGCSQSIRSIHGSPDSRMSRSSRSHSRYGFYPIYIKQRYKS